MVGTTKDPDNGPAVAGSVFAAVIVYVVRPSFFSLTSKPPTPPILIILHASLDFHQKLILITYLQVFLVFCGFQAFLHNRQSKRGAISLN